MKINKNLKLTILVALSIVSAILTIYTIKKYNLSGDADNLREIVIQEEADFEIKQDLEDNLYELENAKVYQNPYGTSPLSALVVFSSPSKGNVKVTVKGKNGNDLITNYELADENYIPVYGLYGDYDNEVILETDDGGQRTFTIRPQYSQYIVNTHVKTSDFDEISNIFYFTTSSDNNRSMALDEYGDIRWYSDDFYYNIIELQNGHLLVSSNLYNDKNMTTVLYEIDFLGRIYREFNIEEGFSEKMAIRSDGHVLLTSSTQDSDDDYIMELDTQSGKIVKMTSIFDMMNAIDSNLKRGDIKFYNTGMDYDSESDKLILSYSVSDFIMCIDYDSSTIEWILAEPSKFSLKFTPLILNMSSNTGEYPKSPLSATYRNGVLKYIDGGLKYSEIEEDRDYSAYKSFAKTYEVSNRTINLIEKYTPDEGLFSFIYGDYVVDEDIDDMLFGSVYYDDDLIENGVYSLFFTSRFVERKGDKILLDVVIDSDCNTIEKIDMSKGIKFDLKKQEYYYIDAEI